MNDRTMQSNMIRANFPVRLAGLGWYLPERVVTSAELETKWGIPAQWIGRVTGVRERRYAAAETSAGMAAAAARMALDQAGISGSSIDLIVGASAAPQQALPCTAAFVQRELALTDGASACFDVNATCLSFLAALQAVSHLVAAGTYRCALIVSSEITSHSLNPAEPESAGLFGDAAAAAVVVASAADDASYVGTSLFETHSSGAELTAVRGGGTLHHPNDPNTTAAMSLFQMDGPGVLAAASRLLDPFMERFLRESGRAPADFDAVIPHQASRAGVRLLWTRYGFHRDQVVLNLETRGNCVGASIPLALAEAVHDGRLHRGQRLLLVGTGAGLTLGAMELLL
jgi:3-oxoacyl-[acyl-carrier-protein] synthase-3